MVSTNNMLKTQTMLHIQHLSIMFAPWHIT